jgi:hypothetical protein
MSGKNVKRKPRSENCKVRGCGRVWLASGYCAEHYLKRLDAVEKRERKLVIGGQR